MADRSQVARTRRERARATWDREVGPRLRRAADASTPAPVAVLELLGAAPALRELGVRSPCDVDPVIDSIRPGTPFRREARLAAVAARLAAELDRTPTLRELVEAAATAGRPTP